MLIKQEMFDKVARHLLTQNSKSLRQPDVTWYIGLSICAYHGVDNKKCAIGCLIPDELYKPEMEGLFVYHLFENFPSVYETIGNIDLAFDLQDVHDNLEPIKWKEKLRSVANDHQLNTCVLDNF